MKWTGEIWDDFRQHHFTLRSQESNFPKVTKTLTWKKKICFSSSLSVSYCLKRTPLISQQWKFYIRFTSWQSFQICVRMYFVPVGHLAFQSCIFCVLTWASWSISFINAVLVKAGVGSQSDELHDYSNLFLRLFFSLCLKYAYVWTCRRSLVCGTQIHPWVVRILVSRPADSIFFCTVLVWPLISVHLKTLKCDYYCTVSTAICCCSSLLLNI